LPKGSDARIFFKKACFVDEALSRRQYDPKNLNYCRRNPISPSFLLKYISPQAQWTIFLLTFNRNSALIRPAGKMFRSFVLTVFTMSQFYKRKVEQTMKNSSIFPTS